MACYLITNWTFVDDNKPLEEFKNDRSLCTKLFKTVLVPLKRYFSFKYPLVILFKAKNIMIVVS